MIQYRIKFLLVFLTFLFRLQAAVPPRVEQIDLKLDSKQDKNNTEVVLKILKEHGIDKSQLSVAVHELQSNKTVFNYREKAPHIPASVTKVFTTYFALNVLDPETKFSTRLSYSGKIHNGVLIGDLYLIEEETLTSRMTNF